MERHFVQWYCSEPRLALNRIVVTRYRTQREQLHARAVDINQRLAAVRRLAYEAADAGLPSPELAAGIRRVKGAKQPGVRLGNWLTAEQGRTLIEAPDAETLRGKRNRAISDVLLACGLRRSELVHLTIDHLQQREDHWAIVDFVGKGGHVRTVPVPDWVKQRIDDWRRASDVVDGCVFRSKRWPPTTFAARAPASVRCCRWRPRTDPVPSRARIGADDRALSWVQAEGQGCRK